MRASRVWQLIRRVTHESIMLAFAAFALWPTAIPVEEGGPHVLRGPPTHVRPSQWYDFTQDGAPDRDEVLAGARRTVSEYVDPPLTPSFCSGAHIVTKSDLYAPDQSLFLNPCGPRSPP